MALHRLNHGPHVIGIEREGNGEERRRLQVDPALPALARLGEDRPGDADLRAQRIDVRADRADAVMLGGAQREIHARRHVGGGPVRLAVLADILQRARESAVRIGAAWPDMALVEMGMGLDEGREEDAAVEVDHFGGMARGAAGRIDGGDGSAGDGDIDEREIAVGLGRERAGQQAARRTRVPDQEVRHHRSFFIALSCQSFSSR